MYEIIRSTGDGPPYPLDYESSRLVKPFEKLRDALNYWKREKLFGSDGFFLVVVEAGARPTALRLEKEHFQ